MLPGVPGEPLGPVTTGISMPPVETLTVAPGLPELGAELPDEGDDGPLGLGLLGLLAPGELDTLGLLGDPGEPLLGWLGDPAEPLLGELADGGLAGGMLAWL